MNNYSFNEKREYHFQRRKRLEKKLIKDKQSLSEKEYTQLFDSIGFLTGVECESQKDMKEFSKGVKHGINAYHLDKSK